MCRKGCAVGRKTESDTYKERKNMLKKLIASYAQKENRLLEAKVQEQKKHLPQNVECREDAYYLPEERRDHSYQVFLPTDWQEEKCFPVIINVHGGGMVCGIKEQNALFNAMLSAEGYLVVSMEYPLAPEATVYEMLRNLSAGLNHIYRELEYYPADLQKVYWTGDSAGAYLITYLAIARGNKPLREAFGLEEIQMPVCALGLISGMFYINKKDKIGMVLPKYLFGEGYRKTPQADFLNLEREDLLRNLPPAFLVTSESDMLKAHTFYFAKRLQELGKDCKLKCFAKDKRLEHAFVALFPEYPESREAYLEMIEFFREK